MHVFSVYVHFRICSGSMRRLFFDRSPPYRFFAVCCRNGREANSEKMVWGKSDNICYLLLDFPHTVFSLFGSVCMSLFCDSAPGRSLVQDFWASDCDCVDVCACLCWVILRPADRWSRIYGPAIAIVSMCVQQQTADSAAGNKHLGFRPPPARPAAGPAPADR